LSVPDTHSNSMKTDKREARRFRVDGLEGRMALVTQVDIVDVSLGGVAVKVDRRLNINAECTLKLQQNEDAVSVKGVVVRCSVAGFIRRDGESVPQYAAGLKFVDVADEKREALARFLDQNRAFKQQLAMGPQVELAARGRAELDEPHAFEVKLLSLTGMIIEMDRALDPRRTYSMSVHVDRTPVQLVGRVSSQFERDHGRHEIGIEFVEVSPGDWALLKAMLHVLAQRPPRRAPVY
jgi:hypothetical protein